MALACAPWAEEDGSDPRGESAYQPQRLLGDYELIQKIAAGGMGVVWRARQRSLHRIVAIKLIRTGWLATEEEVQRFRTEAEAAANLDHPNIVPIYEIGEEQDWHYFSMKLIEGANLAQRLSRPGGRLTPSESASLTATVARAVHHAHQRGVLHRDLKPSNILLDEHGQPHLTDFGLAKWMERGGELTQSTAVLGTPAYMPPEQAAGHSRQITTAGDVYSLGAILYELITGRPTFTGEDQFTLIRQVLESEPRRPRGVEPAIDEDLETICLKCLEKNPQHRYGSALELAQDLERWLRHEPISARPVTRWERARKWVRRHPLAAGLSAAVALCLGLGIAGYHGWQRARSERKRADASRVDQELQRIEEHFARQESHLALGDLARLLRQNPDNQVAAERLLCALRQRVFLLPARRSFRPAASGVAPEDGAGRRHPSPASRWRITGIGTNRIEVLDPTSGQVRLAIPEAHDKVIRDVRLSPDARFILSGAADYTAKVHEFETGLRRFTLAHSNTVHHVEMSPDGKLILTASRDATARLWGAADGQLLAVMPHGDSLNTARFSDDGMLIVTACDDGTVQVWDGASGQVVSEPVRLPDAASDAWFVPGSHDLVAQFGSTQSVAFVLSAPAPLLPATRADLAAIGAPANPARLEALQRRMVTRDGAVAKLFDLTRDEQLAAALIGDRLVRVWDTRTLQAVGAMLVHDTPVSCARFSADGRRVVTGTSGRKVRIWDARTGMPLCDWIASPEEFAVVQFSTEGRWILCSAGWKWSYVACDGPAPAWLARLAESLALNPEPKAAANLNDLVETLSGQGSSPDAMVQLAREFFGHETSPTATP